MRKWKAAVKLAMFKDDYFYCNFQVSLFEYILRSSTLAFDIPN